MAKYFTVCEHKTIRYNLISTYLVLSKYMYIYIYIEVYGSFSDICFETIEEYNMKQSKSANLRRA